MQEGSRSRQKFFQHRRWAAVGVLCVIGAIPIIESHSATITMDIFSPVWHKPAQLGNNNRKVSSGGNMVKMENASRFVNDVDLEITLLNGTLDDDGSHPLNINGNIANYSGFGDNLYQPVPPQVYQYEHTGYVRDPNDRFFAIKTGKIPVRYPVDE